VNNMGRTAYDATLEPFTLTLKQGEQVTFRHRLVVASGDLGDEEINQIRTDFIQE
jgi:hypothetical protein